MKKTLEITDKKLTQRKASSSVHLKNLKQFSVALSQLHSNYKVLPQLFSTAFGLIKSIYFINIETFLSNLNNLYKKITNKPKKLNKKFTVDNIKSIIGKHEAKTLSDYSKVLL